MTTEFNSREEAWETLYSAMHEQLNLPRKDWPEDLDERISASNKFLAENPAPKEGHGAPVTITLSPASMQQIRDELRPIKDIAQRLTKAVDLISEMADAQELWTAFFTESAGLINEKGNPIKFTNSELAWMRDIMGRVMMFAGREDTLPEVEYEYDEPVAPHSLVAEPQVIAVDAGEAVIVVKEEAPEEKPAKSREARNPAWAALQSEKPNQQPTTPGVEVWEDAPKHDCRAELDVDDLCTVCGNHIPTGPGANRG